MTNEEVVRAACDVIWSQGDYSRVAEFYSEDITADYPMADWGSGLQGVANLASGIREAFPDYREQIDDLIDGGDDIVVKLTIRGTHSRPYLGVPATGKEVEFRDVTICRVLNGKIVKQSGLSDYMTMFTQLGLIEPPQLS